MADTLISSAAAAELDAICPAFDKYNVGSAIQAALSVAGIAASDTTISLGDSTDTIAIGSATAGTVTISSNSTITVGNAEANSLTLSGGAGLASLDGTTVAVGPATTSTIAIGSATAGAVTVGSNSTITIGNAECNGIVMDVTNLGVQIGATTTSALAIGGGTSTTPLTSASTDKKFLGFWTKSTDATGTDMRGMYLRHYLSGAGGAQSGEAGRFYTTVSTSAANAARGIHSSLDFGTSGDISGLGAALDATLHVPNGNLGGTVAAVSADINGDGASSDITGTGSFFRASLQGTTTNLQDVYFLNVEGTGSAAAYNSGEMYVLSNSGTITEAIKIKTPAGDRWIPLLSATVAP